MKGQSGFTLVELLIALLVGGIVVGAISEFYVNQHYHLNQQISVAELQQNLRSAVQEVTDNLRMAGYGMPEGLEPLIASNTNPDTIQIVYRKTPNGEATIEHPMPKPSAELRCDGHDLSGFQDNTWAYIYDPAAKAGEYFLITKVQVAAEHLQHNTMPLSKSYPAGSQVFSVESFKYFIDASDTANPILMRERMGESAQPFSEGIADLQLTYQLANGAWTDVPPLSRAVRAVQVAMVAQAHTADAKIVGGKRERALSALVQIRNLGM